MADEVDNITSSLQNIFGGLMGGMTVGIIVLVVLAIIGVAVWFIKYRRQFDIRIEILSSRRDNTFSVFEDKAAILKDKKTGHRYLRLWSTKVELPLPPFDVMEKTNKGDLIRIWRKTNDEFVFITKPAINKTRVLRQDGRYYQVAEQEYQQLEGDIAFWNLKRKQNNRDIFSNEGILAKVLLWMPQIMSAVFVVLILYILLNSLPTLIEQLIRLADRLGTIQAVQNATG